MFSIKCVPDCPFYHIQSGSELLVKNVKVGRKNLNKQISSKNVDAEV